MVEAGLTNDGVYICNQCDDKIQVFSESGNTNFCPSCGSRDLQDVEEDQELGSLTGEKK